MNGKHTHKLMNVFKIAWLQQSKCTNRHGFHTRKIQNKTWFMMLNPAVQHHGEGSCNSVLPWPTSSMCSQYRHRHRYIEHPYTKIHCQTQKSTNRENPASPNGPTLFPFLVGVLVRNTHKCIYAVGIPSAAELRHTQWLLILLPLRHASSSGGPEPL